MSSPSTTTSRRNIRPHEAIDDLESLYKGPSPSFIAREFDLSRLHSIRHLLWLAGRPYGEEAGCF
ncbi:hypothetical protein B0H65DRAFT_476526 [Neurospora tetraspora]|uniref:Uncharacterized protein n=1 Tax=Neurospora tetraspora TaxID=94610 RepID=A0AAE0MNT9_9PEZI|nr:hypothetical protein B0H65DRAFT_476526 [Neurospora tetraspora]